MDNHLPLQESVMDPILEERLFKGNSEGNCDFRKALFGLLRNCNVKLDTSEYDKEGRYTGIKDEQKYGDSDK